MKPYGEYIGARFQSEERNDLELLAKKYGLSMSETIRRLVRKEHSAESEKGTIMESQQAKSFRLLQEALEQIKNAKPNDRSVEDRAYAVVITDLEKTVAYFGYWINLNASVRDLP